MFKFFKEKLNKWTKKVSEEVESVENKKPKKDFQKGKKKEREEIPLPKKFNVGTQSYEPDLEKLRGVKDFKSEKKSFLKNIKSKVGKVKISDEEFKFFGEDLRMLLLENNVAFEVSEKIIEELEDRVVGKEFLKKEIESEIKNSLKDIMEKFLIEPFDIIEKIKEKSKKPYVILFAGVNGTGKTTTLAKIANFLKKKKFSCVFAAADTFRAASIEQLEKHGENLGVKVISHEYNSDPASVGFDAIKYAEKNKIDVVLIDTAGRMHTSKNLLKEIEKIVKVCKPDLKIFIGESITGNDSVEQAKNFKESIDMDGIILTKSDIDEKGGTALSLGYTTKKPILFLGTGQEYDKIEVFSKDKFLNKLGF
ncbi:MAG: signal recognition particle-docking protein FtsY [Candidatus Pacearchaeota archaeon]